MKILDKKGYTLMEIMIVVIIIGILSAAAIPYYKDHIERQKSATGITVMRMIGDSVERYMTLHGETLPENFDFTKLDLDIDHSKLSPDFESYIDGDFIFTISNNAVNAARNTGDIQRIPYTLSYSLGDDVGAISCESSTENYCTDTLHITCGS